MLLVLRADSSHMCYWLLFTLYFHYQLWIEDISFTVTLRMNKVCSANGCYLARSFHMGCTAGILCDKCILLGTCSCLMCGLAITVVKGGSRPSRELCSVQGFHSVETCSTDSQLPGAWGSLKAETILAPKNSWWQKRSFSECQSELLFFISLASLPANWSQRNNPNRVSWQQWKGGSFSPWESGRTRWAAASGKDLNWMVSLL